MFHSGSDSRLILYITENILMTPYSDSITFSFTLILNQMRTYSKEMYVRCQNFAIELNVGHSNGTQHRKTVQTLKNTAFRMPSA